ncbi:MAG: M48 family metallopeptidase [Spirochaetota bacterium]
MSSQAILIIYLSFFAAEFIFENFLTFLNINSVVKHRGKVPEIFKEYIAPEKFELSTEYTLARSRFSLLTSAISAILLLFIVLSGALGIIDTWVKALSIPGYLHGIVYIFIISLVFKFISLPFSLYSQFVIEARFGFNRMTIPLFFLDLLKGVLVSAVIMLPLLAGLFWFMDRAGEYWWSLAFAFIVVFQLLITILYPLVIAPLFNKFTPLEDGPLKEKLENLAGKLSFKTKGIFVMDGSKRSKHSNAYFTGLGRSKRIVLFDTLVKLFTPDELSAVLAHEIGHAKRRHVVKGLVLSLALMCAGLFIVSLLLHVEPLFKAFGFSRPSNYGILVVLSFCSGPFTFFLTPLFTAWSRKHEYEADRFAVDATGGADGLKNALITLGKDNLSNLTPHPLYSFYHYSHPTLGERIKAIEKYAAVGTSS